MKKEFKMSQARFDELQKELNYLKTTRSDEVAEKSPYRPLLRPSGLYRRGNPR